VKDGLVINVRHSFGRGQRWAFDNLIEDKDLEEVVQRHRDVFFLLIHFIIPFLFMYKKNLADLFLQITNKNVQLAAFEIWIWNFYMIDSAEACFGSCRNRREAPRPSTARVQKVESETSVTHIVFQFGNGSFICCVT
jgi:hypothetical protein